MATGPAAGGRGRRRQRAREEPADLAEDRSPADHEAVGREIGLRLLEARARSRAELAKAMARKGVPDEITAGVLDRFEEVGLVDDAQFASLWVEGQQRRMKSARALKQELRLKGVDAEVIGEALADTDDDADYEAALALAQKKMRTLGNVEPQVRYRRLAGALARRGFSPGLSHRVVSEVTDAEVLSRD
ncbi:MAG: recombination regulator RecX [Propionibacteriaceae bacterium]|nr:recombination regulator RecX [Propionibacteriaceae bacterium]